MSSYLKRAASSRYRNTCKLYVMHYVPIYLKFLFEYVLILKKAAYFTFFQKFHSFQERKYVIDSSVRDNSVYIFNPENLKL